MATLDNILPELIRVIASLSSPGPIFSLLGVSSSLRKSTLAYISTVLLFPINDELSEAIFDEAITFDDPILYNYYEKIDITPNLKRLSLRAASLGSLNILKMIRKTKDYLDNEICFFAARSGQLEVLQWARKHGCYWDETVCNLAAYNGHLEVLHWAMENGYDWDPDMLYYALMLNVMDSKRY